MPEFAAKLQKSRIILPKTMITLNKKAINYFFPNTKISYYSIVIVLYLGKSYYFTKNISAGGPHYGSLLLLLYPQLFIGLLLKSTIKFCCSSNKVKNNKYTQCQNWH